MPTIDKDKNNDKTKKPVAGFNVNPQNINKNGRPPKEFSMTNTLREILNIEDKETRLKNYEQIMVTAVEKAKSGDNDMIKYLVNRLEGMPVGTAPTLNVENLEQLVIVRDYHGNSKS